MTAGLAGLGHLVRLILRLDRIKLALWLIGLSVLIAVTPTAVRGITQSEADKRSITIEQVLARDAAVTESNAVAAALQGPYDSLETLGGRYFFEIGAFSFALIGLMNVLLVGRHTRAEEQSGRAELIRSGAVGPWAGIAAVGLVALLANAVLGTVTFAAFAVDGQPVAPSLLVGLAISACGLVFAAISLVSVQVFEYSRAATGASIAAIAVAFAIRAVGDSQNNGISLLSPIGWSQGIDAFGESRPWLLALSGFASLAAVGVATRLATRRDVGQGLLRQRPGPETAPVSLGTPLGLALRLHRSALVWWTVGLAFFGAMYGSVLSLLDDFAGDNETMMEALEAMGISPDALRVGFISVLLSMFAIVAAAGVAQTLLRPRGEENAGHAEPVLATAIGRTRWLGSHLLITVLAAPLFMIVATVAMFVSDGLVVGEFSDVAASLGAALVRVPAIWAIAGIGSVLYGLSVRYALGVWVVFAVAVVVFMFGELLRLPGVVLNLSVVRHVTHAPNTDQGWLAVVVLSAIAAVGIGLGLWLFERRDLGG